jgi:hypothetical protein
MDLAAGRDTSLLHRLNRWSLSNLPRLNRAIIAREDPPETLAAELMRSVLPALPRPELLGAGEAQQVVVHLGLWGASVARHFQEQDPAGNMQPHLAFLPLEVGAARTPFREYFARAADATGTGHHHRDSYASLVRWNAPTVEVYWADERLAVLPGSFPDARVRTYTGHLGERLFFRLVKESEALELAANQLLEPLVLGRIAVTGEEALHRMHTATGLLVALHRLNTEFAARPEDQCLTPEHFMDVFRQFAVHWMPGDIPPTGAQDPQFLLRDFLLGIDFPDYAAHIRRIFPALLDAERDLLTAAAEYRPLPALLLDRLGLDGAELATASPDWLYALLRAHPELGACYQLLAANARMAGFHLSLIKKYLFKPSRARESAGVADSLLVSNRAGTTGMQQPLLDRLVRARQNHLLAGLRRIPARAIELAAGTRPAPAITAADLADILRYPGGAGGSGPIR